MLLIYEWRKKSLGMVLWAMLFVVFTVPNTAHAYSGDYSDITIANATMLAVLFMALYMFTRFFYFAKFNAEKLEMEVSDFEETPEALFRMIFCVYLICFVIVAGGFYGRGYSLFNSTWTQTLNMAQTPIEIMAGKVMVAFSGIGFACLCKKKRLCFLIAFIIYLFCALYSKSRYNLLGFITPFIIYFLFNKNNKKVAVGVSAGIVLVFAVFVFQQIRWLGDISLLPKVGIGEIFKRSIDYMRKGGGELGLIKAYYYFVEHNNNFPKFGMGLGYMRLALLFVPAAIAKFKPRDFAIDMYKEWMHVDNPRGTMHPTLFGDVFANFGFMCFLLGIVYGILVSFVDEFIKATKDPTMRCMKASMVCTLFILIGRGATYNAIFNYIIGSLVLDIIYVVYKIWRKASEDTLYQCS